MSYDGAVRALEDQADLIRVWQSRGGEMLGREYIAALREAVEAAGQPLTDFSKYSEFSDSMAETLNTAETYLVEPNMCRLVAAAAATIPLKQIVAADIPSVCGFVRLAEPWNIVDDDDRPVRAAAMTWDITHWYPNGCREEGEIPIGSIAVFVDADGPGGELHKELRRRSLIPTSQLRLKWVVPLSSLDPSDTRFPGLGPDVRESATGIRYWHARIQTLWALMQQRVATVGDVRLSRAALRRRQRSTILADVDRVKVVTLRPARHCTEGAAESEPGNWSHQWIVGGHWRDQPYRSTGDRRLIWIAPYVKGPDHLPLVVKDTVWDLRR